MHKIAFRSPYFQIYFFDREDAPRPPQKALMSPAIYFMYLAKYSTTYREPWSLFEIWTNT